MRLRARAGAWSWARLARVTALVLAMLASVDAALASRERTLEADLWSGRLRNAAGPGIADATRWALLEGPDAKRSDAIALVGSSVTFGPGLHAGETIPAQLASLLVRRGAAHPVVNLAQPGGAPRTVVPVAAALGTHPIRVLLVELLVPSYAEREQAPAGEIVTDEVALLRAAGPAQNARLAAAGWEPRAALRIEAMLSSAMRSSWRLYRMRGSLWWDSEQTPNYLVWSLRREAATAGFLPRRFHGQTTNVGQLPWRIAYTGGQRPGENQRFRVPTGRISEPDYACLTLARDLAASAGVPILYYEIPLNLAFQREFGLMGEDDLARLERLRGTLLARMTEDGMRVVEAPVVPDDGFLDKAHLTPSGSAIVAEHLADSLRDSLSQRR